MDVKPRVHFDALEVGGCILSQELLRSDERNEIITAALSSSRTQQPCSLLIVRFVQCTSSLTSITNNKCRVFVSTTNVPT